MEWLRTQGWIVDNASPGNVGNCNKHYVINMSRSPFSYKNVMSYFYLKKIIDTNNYRLIHCHTPIGGFLTRLAARKARKKGTKIIYTAHGFHFFKGAPLQNWLFFYPVELLLSKYTDCLITINSEDYEFAQKYNLSAGGLYKINGIGVDLKCFTKLSTERKIKLREEYGYLKNDFILLYTAQFIVRKNHGFLIKSLPYLKKKIPTLKVLFAGSGITMDFCKSLALQELVKDIVNFLGERDDINFLCNISDIHVSPSIQEGLGMNNIEAMACGLPIVCSNIRGHRDAVVHGRNGFLFDLNNSLEMNNAIISIYNDLSLREKISANNLNDVQLFSEETAVTNIGNIYKQFL
jgi:glycosyltransferase EpsD